MGAGSQLAPPSQPCSFPQLSGALGVPGCSTAKPEPRGAVKAGRGDAISLMISSCLIKKKKCQLQVVSVRHATCWCLWGAEAWLWRGWTTLPGGTGPTRGLDHLRWDFPDVTRVPQLLATWGLWLLELKFNLNLPCSRSSSPGFGVFYRGPHVLQTPGCQCWLVALPRAPPAHAGSAGRTAAGCLRKRKRDANCGR